MMIHRRHCLPGLLLFFLLQPAVRAQSGELPVSTRDRFQSNGVKPGTGYYIYGLEGGKGTVNGDYYLDSTWQTGKVQFYPHTVTVAGKPLKLDTITHVPIRLDLNSNEVEFRTDRGVKAMLGETIRFFTVTDVAGSGAFTFVNVREFGGKAAELKGFFEVLGEGELKALLHTKLWVKNPTYVAALDVGSKDAQILKNQQYYCVRGNEVEKLGPGRSGLLKRMQDKKDAVRAYLRSRDFDLRNPRDLATIFTYYNRLP
ncbi:MAG: hypothetical protein H7Z75_17840 [Ferruginibacter sp.]|nr:hypothetical protein [Cytophagales bacterium]